MQAITGPWPTFIREIQREVLGEQGFHDHLDWGHTRGRDFQCFAAIAYLASKYPSLSHPAAPALERWMQDPKPIPQLLHSRLISTFGIFVNLARDSKLRGPLQQPTRVSPVEFVMIGLLIFVHSRTLSMQQLSSAIERLRSDVRSNYIDIRLNTRTLKHMFEFVCKKMARSQLKSDGKGDVPAATSQTPSKATKRKRSDDDEDEFQVSKSTKWKSKVVESVKETASPAKRKTKTKTNTVATTEQDVVKPPRPPTSQPIAPPVSKPAAPLSQKAAVVKPPIALARRAQLPKKTGNIGANSTSAPQSPAKITTGTMPAKMERTEPALFMPPRPVPTPPNRKLAKKSPPSVGLAVPSSTQASPSVPSPRTPILIPAAQQSAPPIASSSSAPPIINPNPPRPQPVAPPPPPLVPVQTEVIVKTEQLPSPPPSILSAGLMRPSNDSTRLASLRAARAAVNTSKLEMPSPILASPLPQPSPTLPLTPTASIPTRDPRRRPGTSVSQLPSPVEQPAPSNKTALSHLEDLLVHGNNQSSASGLMSAAQLASPSLPFLPHVGDHVHPNVDNAQMNSPTMTSNAYNLQGRASPASPQANGEADMDISPTVPQTQSMPVIPHFPRDFNGQLDQAQQSETNISSTTANGFVDNLKIQSPISPHPNHLPPETPPAPMSSSNVDLKASTSPNIPLPERIRHSLPARPRSTSGSLSGTSYDQAYVRERDRYRDRSQERSPESRYGHPDGPPRSSRRNSQNYYRDRDYRRDYDEWERSRYRGRDGSDRDWEREGDRYGDRGRDRDRDSRGYWRRGS